MYYECISDKIEKFFEILSISLKKIIKNDRILSPSLSLTFIFNIPQLNIPKAICNYYMFHHVCRII